AGCSNSEVTNNAAAGAGVDAGAGEGASTSTANADPADTALRDAMVSFDGDHQAGITATSHAVLNLLGFNLKDFVGKKEFANLMLRHRTHRRRKRQASVRRQEGRA